METVKFILEKYGLGIPFIIVDIILWIFYFIYISAASNTVIEIFTIKFTKRVKNSKLQFIILILITVINIGFVFLIKNPMPLLQNDEWIMHSMIEKEAEAVNKKEISIIDSIFMHDAIITDAQSGKVSKNPIEYYKDKFQQFTFSGSVNYYIKQINNDGNQAIFICASQGKYGKNREYDNPQGSSEWKFQKDSRGKWKIIQFTYNIKLHK